MKVQRGVWIGGAVLAVVLGVEVLAGVQAAETALHPARRVLTAASALRMQSMTARIGAHWREASVTAADGAVLHAWAMVPAHSNGNAVLLLHGHRDNRMGMMNRAEILLRHGYAVLVPDARAHGQSGGNLATYGVLEAGDVRLWYDWLETNLHPRCVDGYGASMGAAAVLESLATTPGYCAVVADSPFASFREVSYDRVGQGVHLGDWFGRTLGRPVVDVGFAYARLRYGQNLEKASPLQALPASHVPVLLLHGEQDTNVPIRHARLLLAAAKDRQPQIVFWPVAHSEHTMAIKTNPAEFEQRVTGWFDAHPAAH